VNPAAATATGVGLVVERGAGPALRHGGLVAARNVRVAVRNPRSVLATVVFPLIFFFGFLAVFRRTLEARGLDYEQYLPPIVVIQAMFFTGLASAAALADDRLRGLLERCRSLPINRWAPLVGRVAADVGRAAVSIAVLLAAATAIGFRFEAGPVAAAGFVAVALLFAVAACAAFGAVGLAAPDPQAVLPTLALPYLVLLMLSTGFVPVEGFPGWLQPVVRWQPVSLTAEALRALAAGGSTAVPVLRAVAVLAVLAGAFGLVGSRAYRDGAGTGAGAGRAS
jgi:ABC-2 type transport system permease protein